MTRVVSYVLTVASDVSAHLTHSVKLLSNVLGPAYKEVWPFCLLHCCCGWLLEDSPLLFVASLFMLHLVIFSLEIATTRAGYWPWQWVSIPSRARAHTALVLQCRAG
jgi:hypothetical protein